MYMYMYRERMPAAGVDTEPAKRGGRGGPWLHISIPRSRGGASSNGALGKAHSNGASCEKEAAEQQGAAEVELKV